MAYTNSPLVSYKKISPNRSVGRTHAIDTITIHMVVGQASVESLGNVFAPTSRKASSNYGVGYDGRIGMYVEEKDRAWTSSSSTNDNRAVTIEVASDTTKPYAVNAKAYTALIDLVTDVCKRNKIKKLLWKNDKSLIGQVDKQNMTIHRWFAATNCPGDYLYEHMGDIAAKVNERLGETTEAPAPSKPVSGTTTTSVKVGDIVKIKPGSKYYNGKDIPDWVEGKQWVVSSVKGNRVVIDKSVDGKNSIASAINASCLVVVKGKPDISYQVKIDVKNLRIRKGPGTNYAKLEKFTGAGVFTIVEEADGVGASKWGLLKSYETHRDGWISLDYAKKV